MWTKAVMTKLGLTLNEVKTSVRDARTECFDFLAKRLDRIATRRNGKPVSGREFIGEKVSS